MQNRNLSLAPPASPKKTRLADMRDYVQSYAEVISRVIGIDVEIMDSDMTRIAGTGIYAEGVGKSLNQAGEVYKEVMRSHQTILVESPRSHAVCLNCPDRENCPERFSLATPIVAGDSLLGVIGLVCFNDVDRERVMASLASYRPFVAFLADALAHKIGEADQLKRTRTFLELLLHIVDIPGQGVMLFDNRGELIYSNTLARELFALDARPESGPQMHISAIGRGKHDVSGYDAFEVHTPGGAVCPMLGRLEELDTHSQDKSTLFVFEMPTRLAKLVGNLSSGSTGTGFDAIIGDSLALQDVKERARKVADSVSTVLINGESGTGKELLARALHMASGRRDHPFVAINCGAIPDTLLESELFGYVSGAFTGASSKGRMGKFELAQGGVIFLDEISNMPLYLQVKLLRVLQERIITRLGSNHQIHIDIRIIAASNENLAECIQRKSFRDDLYYRLNVIPLTMPPLRERTGDIPILVDYFMEKYCALFNKRHPRVRASLLKLLGSYSWPGNIRELEHALEYAVNMMPENGPLLVDCLPAQLREKIRYAPDTTGRAQPEAAPDGRLKTPLLTLAVLEKQAIQAALTRFGESTEGKKLAAKALGVSLATLYRKIALFSI